MLQILMAGNGTGVGTTSTVTWRQHGVGMFTSSYIIHGPPYMMCTFYYASEIKYQFDIGAINWLLYTCPLEIIQQYIIFPGVNYDVVKIILL